MVVGWCVRGVVGGKNKNGKNDAELESAGVREEKKGHRTTEPFAWASRIPNAAQPMGRQANRGSWRKKKGWWKLRKKGGAKDIRKEKNN
jgi:hypothetical protein